MEPSRLRVLLPLLCLLASGCAHFGRRGTASAIEPVALEVPARKTIYVVGHGWHTGLILKARDVDPAVWPEVADFPEARYVELGWGDEGFYRAKKITPALIAKAALWPTPSVMHVVSFPGSVAQTYPYSDIVKLEIEDEDFETLCRFIGASFERRDEAGHAQDLGLGLYGESRFYRARGKYYVPKTCNVWTARALARAGVHVVPAAAMTAENLLFQARLSGEDFQRSPKWVKRAALGGE
jgi:uncharacterized protein (TIGR02117 family)